MMRPFLFLFLTDAVQRVLSSGDGDTMALEGCRAGHAGTEEPVVLCEGGGCTKNDPGRYRTANEMILYGEEQPGREIHMGFAARFPFLHLILCHVRVRESDGRGDAFFQTRPCKRGLSSFRILCCFDALYLSLNPGKCSKLNYPAKGMKTCHVP